MEHPDPLLALWSSERARRVRRSGLSLLQHGWQCARLAAQAHATAELQLACWLHDIGHLLVDQRCASDREGGHECHETVGARFLEPLFGPLVSEPVALHVLAKRYRVTANPRYAQILSSEARRSLSTQGGPLSAGEASRFISHPLAGDALRLRAWDECAQLLDWRPASDDSALSELTALIDQVRSQVVLSAASPMSLGLT
jgi:predicted HD phosphohydrolase